MNNTIRRNVIFIFASLIFYLVWSNGGEKIYAKVVATGVEKFTAKISSIESAEYKHFDDNNMTVIYCKYPDRTTNIAVEYCLPVVLLLAWNFALFFDKRLQTKTAFKYLGINFGIIYTLQIFFPLLLLNISQSKAKSTSLFIGLQIFSFIVLFLIIKDSLILKYKFSEGEQTN
ncbi:MAG: hypothetical protein K9G70_05845 [Prolixibacteraceae bacterium]|nr:hypothetical protein [Prolixibacteraceae bacterium]